MKYQTCFLSNILLGQGFLKYQHLHSLPNIIMLHDLVQLHVTACDIFEITTLSCSYKRRLPFSSCTP